MQRSSQEIDTYEEDEINLSKLFGELLAKRNFIFASTVVLTFLAIIYALNIAPTYKAISSFTSPSSSSITNINRLNLTSETKDSVFGKFLTNLSSKDLQKKVFIEGDFITSFNTDNIPIDDVEAFIYRATKSVSVHSPNLNQAQKKLAFLTELPYSITIEGNSAETISEYLNTLVTLANSETIIGLIKHNELKISNRLYEISLERDLLIEEAEKNRFSKIERIKEEDGQKIRQINDQIDRIRYEAKENRLNQIVVLNDSAKLAKSLGIIENNFKLINDGGAKSDLTIAIGESKDLPEWYLYGEKALIKRVELLENRISDDPFIPELVTLNNQLNEVKNNNLLKTLKMRQDDSPFIDEIAKLDIEKTRLKSRIVGMNGVSAMQISEISNPQKSPIKPNKRKIVLIAFFGSFMMSVLFVLIMDVLKPDEKDPA